MAQSPPQAPRWQQSEPGGPLPGRRRRRLLAVVVLALVLVSGITVGVLSWLGPTPEPVFVPLWLTRLPDGRTHVPWTDEDRLGLVRGKWLGTAVDPGLVNPSRDHIRLQMHALARARRHVPVVVYLSGPACRLPGGSVYLLPGDRPGDNPRNRLPLRDLLDALRECPARHKLLILDLSWDISDPNQGRICDDVAAEVLHEVESAPDPDRLTLCSCGSGQVAHTSAELGRSVFGHYLEEGLRGPADGWGTTGRDGRVSVRELAAFVQARVARWVRANRGETQEPVLLGSADDFPLRVVEDRAAAAPRELPETESYPDWLQSAWKQRDAWISDGRARAAPQPFLELQNRLTDADHDWYGGRPAGEIQARLQSDLARLEKQAADYTRTDTPNPPPTLALALQTIGDPDRTVTEQLRRAVLQAEARPRTPSPDKPMAPLPLPAELEPFRAKPHLNVALAAIEVLAEEARPPAQRVRLLDQLLSIQQPAPQFFESLLLHRLAQLLELTGEASWPAEPAGALIEASRTIEDVGADPSLVRWLERSLDDTDTLRHEAEALLFSPGFAPSNAATERIRLLRESAQRLQRHALALRLARSADEEALLLLPGIFSALEHLPGLEPVVLTAAEAARQLADLLQAPTIAPTHEELDKLVRDLEARRDAVLRALDDVRRPLRSEALGALRRRAEASEASPALLGELAGILRLPSLPLAERVALWQTRAALARRLNDDTMLLDRLDLPVSPAPAEAAAPSSPGLHQRDAMVLHRAQQALARLHLAGVSEAALAALSNFAQELDTADRMGRNMDAARTRVVRALAQVWQDELPKIAMDARLSRVLVVSEHSSLQDPRTDRVLAERQLQARRLWKWQAARFGYEANDPTDPIDPALGAAFAGAVARVYRVAAGSVPEVEHMSFAPGRRPALTPAVPTMVYQQKFQVTGAPDHADVGVEFFTPNSAWLSQPAPVTVRPGATGEGIIPVRLEPGSTRPEAPGYKGLLIETRLGNRSYHERLPVDLDALTGGLEILIALDPKAAPMPLHPLYLRPIPEPQRVSLFLRNSSARERAVVLRLPDIGRETPRTVLAPGKITPVVFLPVPSTAPPAAPVETPALPATKSPAKPAGLELRALREPLAIELVNAETRDLLQTNVLPVSVADPSRYVDALEVVFVPGAAARPNRLSAQLATAGKLAGPPCAVDMVLPADRNPALGLRDGKLSGVLPVDTSPLILYSDGLDLPAGADREGTVTFTVDGCERAFTFAGTLAHRGPPVRLSPVVQPAVRIKVETFARGDQPLPVAVEVDNAPEDARLELRLGQPAEGDFATDARLELATPRNRSVALAIDPANAALLLQARLRDWQVNFPIEQIVGRRLLQARLLDRTGTAIASDVREVLFDINLPEGVRILDPPARARRDLPVVLKATGAVSVAGIKEVVFFFGKPTNGALPPNVQTFAAQPADSKGIIWKAALPVGERKGLTDVSVKVTSRVGFSDFDSVTIDLMDAAEFLKPQPGNIEGVLREGAIKQDGLKVYLFDARGARLAESTTKPDGTFKFEGLVPGAYTLYSVKTATNRSATKAVEVLPGKTLNTEMELFL